MTIHDVLAFLVSSLIGFTSGYGAGWMGREIRRRNKVGSAGGTGGTGGQGGAGGRGGTGSSGKQGEPGRKGEPGKPGQPGNVGSRGEYSKRSKWFNDKVLGIFVLILTIAAAGSYLQATTVQHRIASCQAAQNTAFGKAIIARSEASHEQNLATKTLVIVVSDPASSEAARHQALTDYIAALDELDAAQRANPLVVGTCS